MPFARHLRVATAVAAVTLTTLVGCTNASQQTPVAAPGGSSASAGLPSVDLSKVTKDATAAALVPSDVAAKGTWVIATGPDYPPAEFLDPKDGQTQVGYDMDLIKAIGLKLGLKVDIKSAQFDSILGGIGSKYDAAISSFTITPQRLQAVDMVSYLKAGSALAVQKGNPKQLTIDNLCGKTIGVQTGSVQETDDLPAFNKKCTDAGKPPINELKYVGRELTTALVGGKLDGILQDTNPLSYSILQTGGAIEVAGEPYSQVVEGIVLPKDSPMSKAVQTALQQLIDQGTYAEILGVWGQQTSEITKAEVNPSVS